MNNGILEAKSNAFVIIIIGLLLFSGCKDKPNPELSKTEGSKTEVAMTESKKTQVSTSTADAKTNIRFATITDGYKEKTSYNRLVTDKTKITSTQFQMEGPAWENENVAFRNYFDARNGMDIYGKRTTEMILDAVGIDENYHELQDWGMDVLKVGNSLGSGAIGMVIKDSLYRVGVGAQGSFRILEEKTNSSTLEFLYKNWKVQDRNYTIRHTINIKSGTHYYEGSITAEGLQGDETFVAGIVDHKTFDSGNKAHQVDATLLKKHDHTAYSTYGTQDVEGRMLGMAIAVANEDFVKVDKAGRYSGPIDKTHLVHLKNNNKYRFFVGWELQDSVFKSKTEFEEMLFSELK